jgi:DNA topoisomerase-1
MVRSGDRKEHALSHIIIVESPAKAKTIEKYLGKEYRVVATMGHVRDLPKHRFGVDIKEGFRPNYEPLPERKEALKKLKEAVKKADGISIATDPDREGEAIAWHVKEALKLKELNRIEFNEITKEAVRKAIEQPRQIDMKRVDAQQARRILDRIVGYTLSPLLSRKIRSGLSAGRVQSVAVRLICEREREILAFKPEEYWSITATLSPQGEPATFAAKLFRRESETDKLKILNNEQAQQILRDLEGASWRILKVEQKEQRRFAPFSFTTSTLQQESSKKLGFSTKRTMSLAQELYEGVELGPEGATGLITYMRTDSTRIAEEAQKAAKEFITTRYGADFAWQGEPRKGKKNENVQDAHEAIRPTDVHRTPEDIAPYLSNELLRLYRLIWQRFVASQMAPAILDQVIVDIKAQNYLFRATGSTVKFQGFLAVYEEARDEDQKDENGETRLPKLNENQLVDLHQLLPKQHFTEPPPRYTEATLVKALEENGIGRPSTYVPTISTIVDREYVKLEKRRFSPTELGFQVTDQLIQHFSKIIDVAFTALIEEELDKVEAGQMKWMNVLEEFYLDFEKDLAKAKAEMKSLKPQPIQTDKDCPKCGNKLVIRTGRYGQFYSCSTFPKCRHSQPLEKENAVATSPAGAASTTASPGEGQPAPEKVCPKCGAPMHLRPGRYGQFYGCTRYPDCDGIEKVRMPAVKSDVPCPKCGGELVQRFARKQGRSFFGCSTYPKCDFTANKIPVKVCPTCQAGVLVEDKEPGFISCSNKECAHKEAWAPVHSEPVVAGH